MRKLILVALIAGVIVVGGYAAGANWLGPHLPPDTAPTLAPQPSVPDSAPAPTIAAAVLNKDGIPEEMGSLSLQQSHLGKDALSEFEAMHGQSLDLKGGYRADYADGSATATLWVGQAQDAGAAETLVKDMADKIGAGNPMFTNLKDLNIGGRLIYEVEGQGKLHFFYASNDKVVWLATDPDHAPDSLHAIWGTFK